MGYKASELSASPAARVSGGDIYTSTCVLFIFPAGAFPGLGTLSGLSRDGPGEQGWKFRVSVLSQPPAAGRFSSSTYPMLCRGRLCSLVFEPSRKPVWKMGFLEEELLGEKASMFLL